MRTSIRSYTELVSFRTFEERFEYLKLSGAVCMETFGIDRWINQRFYSSPEWKRLRSEIIVRDRGCDLAVDDREIYGKIILHHMNPIAIEDILDCSEFVLNPEYLISCSHDTHNAIHYGSMDLLMPTEPTERRPGDTCPWKM